MIMGRSLLSSSTRRMFSSNVQSSQLMMNKSVFNKNIQLQSTIKSSSLLSANQSSIRSIHTTKTNFNNIQKSFAKEPGVEKPTLDRDPFLSAKYRNRPTSPHLTIYEPQLTWLLSISHRVTGGVVLVSLWALGISYVLLPGFSSQAAIDLVASVPDFCTIPVKAVLAASIAYHTFNGFRHLTWDSAQQLSMKGVYQTGYIVLGLTALSTAYYLFQ